MIKKFLQCFSTDVFIFGLLYSAHIYPEKIRWFFNFFIIFLYSLSILSSLILIISERMRIKFLQKNKHIEWVNYYENKFYMLYQIISDIALILALVIFDYKAASIIGTITMALKYMYIYELKDMIEQKESKANGNNNK